MTAIFDHLGQKFEIINETSVDQFEGEGGILAFNRTNVTITINGDYKIEFGIRVKPPCMLYLNGKPCVPLILYETTQFDDGYWYGFYFEKILYTSALQFGQEIPVRRLKAKVAKCEAVIG